METRKHMGTTSSVLHPISSWLSAILSDADYPIPGSIWGIDISHHTGIILATDWQKIKSSGCRFVIIKAMHGKNRANCFEANYAGAKAMSLPVSHYHWLCPAEEVSPAGQAREYAQLCREYPTDFDAWTDFEYTPITVKKDGSSVTVTTEIDDLESFIQTWDVEMPSTPIGIYSSPSYWREHGSINPKWRARRLWIANYGLHDPLPFPDVPLPWTDREDDLVEFWQWTENGDGDAIGTAPGERRVDLNYFTGSESQWQKLLQDAYVPPGDPLPPGDDPMTEKYVATNKSGLNLRDAPNGAIVKLMSANTHIEGTEIVTAADGGLWLHTTLPQIGYCASWLLTYEVVPPVIGDVAITQDMTMTVNGVKYVPEAGTPVKFVKAG